MKSLSQVRQELASGQFEFSRHAFRRAVERNISEQEIREAGAGAEVIENYPDGQYSPSGLLPGFGQRPDLEARKPGNVKAGAPCSGVAPSRSWLHGFQIRTLPGCLGRRRPGGVKQGVFAEKAVFGPKNDFSNFEIVFSNFENSFSKLENDFSNFEIAFSNFENGFSKLENGFSNFESALSKLEDGFSKSERAISKLKNAGSKPESVFSNLENGFSSPAKRPCIPRWTPRKLRAAKNKKERGVLQNAVDSTDRKTDDIVYDIYALTPEEIALVEGAA